MIYEKCNSYILQILASLLIRKVRKKGKKMLMTIIYIFHVNDEADATGGQQVPASSVHAC